jgi:hypothetical protein
MRHIRTAFAALLSFAAFFEATGAHADCAVPRDYVAKVNGNQVTVCPTYSAGDGTCPQTAGMLRVGLSDAGNTIEKLPDFCEAPPSSLLTNGTSCYVDECVPPGTYQYGYATPLDCAQSCGGEFAVEVSVTTTLSGCTSDAGALTSVTSVPWDPSTAAAGAVQNPSCIYRSDSGVPDAASDSGVADAASDSGVADAAPDSGVADAASDSGVADAASDSGVADAASDGGPVETSDGSPQVDSGPSESANDAAVASDASHAQSEGVGGSSSGGGCAVVSLGSTEHTVLGIDALALAFGVVALGCRRTKLST